MLKKRIIPCLDVKGGRVVKGKQFKGIQDVSDIKSLAKYYTIEGADELVLYDISASEENRKLTLSFIEEVAEEINIPFTVGGNIHSIEDFSLVLSKGADKVSINSAAVQNPNLIKEAASKFGNQCVVLSVDVLKQDNDYKVVIKGGKEITELDALEWIKTGVDLGAGEVVINTINTDGMQKGYDNAFIKRVNDAVNVPIIASGGAGKMEDFKDAALCGADGLLAASVFHYKTIKINDLKDCLNNETIPVRRGGYQNDN